MKKLNPLAFVIALTLTLPACLLAQQCQPGQWCSPSQPKPTTAPVYQQQPDPWEETRQRNAAMEAREREEQQANRPMCTTYRTNPATGQVTAVTVPCLY